MERGEHVAIDFIQAIWGDHGFSAARIYADRGAGGGLHHIRKANLNAVRYHANSMNYTDSARKAFQVWDYFSKNN